jgi:hypothetical protein
MTAKSKDVANMRGLQTEVLQLVSLAKFNSDNIPVFIFASPELILRWCGFNFLPSRKWLLLSYILQSASQAKILKKQPVVEK